MEELTPNEPVLEELAEAKPISVAAEEFKAEDYKYEAFISYRHVEPDATIASKIHTMIETFEVPKEFHVNGRKPKYRVFRDREELTTTDLSDSIESALRSSKFLIVICSKRYPLSPWCIKEVETFIALHGIDRVIPVLVEGEPYESFPPILLNYKQEVVDEQGQVTLRSKEILGAEFRTPEVIDRSFVGYEYLEKNDPQKLKSLTSDALKLMKVEKYRIMAAILGVSYGDLKQRDKERRQKRMLQLSALASALLLIFGLFMLNAYRNVTQEKSAMMMGTSERYLEKGDRVLALITAKEAMSDIDRYMDKYDELKSMHFGIMNDAYLVPNATVHTVIETKARNNSPVIRGDSQVLVNAYGPTGFAIWSMDNGQRLQTVEHAHSQSVVSVTFDPEGSLIATAGADQLVKIWDGNSLTEKHTLEMAGAPQLVKFSYDAKYLYVITIEENRFHLRSYLTQDWSESGERIELGSLIQVDFSPNSYHLVTLSGDNFGGSTFNNVIDYFDLESGRNLLHLSEKYFEVQRYTYPETTEPSTEEVKTEVRSFALDKNGKTLYVGYDRLVAAYRLSDGQQLWYSELDSSSDVDSIAVSDDGKSLYASVSIMVFKLDTSNGEQLTKLYFKDGIKQVRQAGPYLATISDDGLIGYAKDDKVVEQVMRYGEGQAQYIRISKEGDKLIAFSDIDQNLKILELQNDVVHKVEGQVGRISQDRKHVMLYSDKVYTVWDVERQEAVFSFDLTDPPEVENGIPLADSYYMWNDTKPKFSNDLQYFSAVNTYSDDKTGEQTTYLEVWKQDYTRTLRTSQGKYQTFVDFTPDSKTLVALDFMGNLRYYNTADGALTLEKTISEGSPMHYEFSDDGKYMAVAFSNGSSEIFEFATAESLHRLQGEILDLRSEDGKLTAHLVNNNTAVVWQDGEVTNQTELDVQRLQLGTNEDDDNHYDVQSNTLLTIKNFDEDYRAFLFDFGTGRLIKHFVVAVDGYPIAGYILNGGKQVLIDSESNRQELPGEDRYDVNLSYDLKSSLYELLPYDLLVEQADYLINTRTLTDEEKQAIGLLER